MKTPIGCGLLLSFAMVGCSSSSPTRDAASSSVDAAVADDAAVVADLASADDAAPGDGGELDAGPGNDGSVAPHALIGVYSDSFATLDTTVLTATGRHVAIENQREVWGTDFAQADEAYDRSNGIIPMISWSVAYKDGSGSNTCATFAKIVGGAYDQTWTDAGGVVHPGLAQEAQTVASWNVPVLIRFFKEFTDTADDQCFYGVGNPGSDPDQYGPMLVEIWQHVVQVFRDNGATNVQWVWGPSANLFGGSNPDDVTWRAFFPGKNYVDWISNDNYNKSDTVLLDYGSDPSIANFYGLTSGLGKPLMQAETGAGYNAALSPDPMTEWIDTAYTTVKGSFPAMKAFLWWSAEGQVDYDLQGTGLTTYEQMVEDPYFGATDVSAYFTSKGNAAGPATPTGVAVSNGKVTWNVPVDLDAAIAFYDVLRDGAIVGQPTTNSFEDVGATSGSHVYQVDAVDTSFDRSTVSSVVTVIVQ